jgi:hypothetical protein
MTAALVIGGVIGTVLNTLTAYYAYKYGFKAGKHATDIDLLESFDEKKAS